MKKQCVFVLAPSGRFLLGNASAFGEIKYLFGDSRDMNPMHGQGAVVKLVEKLREQGYDSRTDAIALTGPVASVAFLLLAASECSEDGSVGVLIFDAREQGTYRMRRLEPQNA